jgi:hypothetical protein
VPAQAQGQSPGQAPARTGAELYQAACAACHGRDGRGAPQALVGLDIPLPDFTDCAFGTPEPDSDWMAVSHDGGPARAFDRRMPAFGGALSVEDLQRVIDHVRTFCTNEAWPRGELNLPRALATEKAFPENEFVITTIAADGEVSNELLYERRVGPRSMFEVKVPIDAVEQEGGGWAKGFGDVAFAVKHAFFHHHKEGSILSVAGEVVFPSGNADRGLGKGVTIFEPFVAYGQMIGSNGFFQAQVGAELPSDRDVAQNEAFVRLAIGRSFSQARWGRTWSPMVEFLAARELVAGEPMVWDVLPEMQITLSKRQHIMMNVGVRMPLNEREGRSTRFLVYLLWDWFDGGFLEAWR